MKTNQSKRAHFTYTARPITCTQVFTENSPVPTKTRKCLELHLDQQLTWQKPERPSWRANGQFYFYLPYYRCFSEAGTNYISRCNLVLDCYAPKTKEDNKCEVKSELLHHQVAPEKCFKSKRISKKATDNYLTLFSKSCNKNES
jgi:hypothetical protein